MAPLENNNFKEHIIDKTLLKSIERMNRAELKEHIKNSNNISLLIDIRDTSTDSDDFRCLAAAARLNQIARQKYPTEISLCIPYRFLPNEILINGLLEHKENPDFFPEILQFFTYMPRQVVEYMTYYMQLFIMPVIRNKEKNIYKFIKNENKFTLNKYYSFPFVEDKEKIYKEEFLEEITKEYCNKNKINYLSHEIFEFYDMRNFLPHEFKVLLILFIDTNESINMFDINNINLNKVDKLSQNIIKLIRERNN